MVWIAVARREPRHRFGTHHDSSIHENLPYAQKRRGAALPAAVQNAPGCPTVKGIIARPQF